MTVLGRGDAGCRGAKFLRLLHPRLPLLLLPSCCCCCLCFSRSCCCRDAPAVAAPVAAPGLPVLCCCSRLCAPLHGSLTCCSLGAGPLPCISSTLAFVRYSAPAIPGYEERGTAPTDFAACTSSCTPAGAPGMASLTCLAG